MKDGLTLKQEMVLRHIFEVTMRDGYQPTFLQIAAHLGSGNKTAALCHVEALRLKGYVGSSTNESRALRLLKKPDGTEFTGFACKEKAVEEA
jgi:SOS-response transcriptional repressor LexA